MTFIIPADLTPFADIDMAKALAMIEDAEAMAALVAPCLPGLPIAPVGETPSAAAIRAAQLSAVRAILRGAVLRWQDSGTGAIQQQSAGPFGVTITAPARKSLFWPSEIEQLQGICKGDAVLGAFSVDTVYSGAYHADICSLNFGALYCSCGAVLTQGFPLWEV